MTIESVLNGSARFTVICGDNREVLPTIPDKGVDHVITDPPYEKESHTKSRRSHRGPPGDKGGFVTFPVRFDAITETERMQCAGHCARLANRWTLWFCQIEGVPLWRNAGEAVGLSHRRTCIWIKPDAAPQFTGDRPGTGYECIEVMHQNRRSRWNGGGRRGVFTYNCNSQTRKPDEDHETPKPLSLMLELIELFTDPGDLILDPFCGSGTTLVAALRLGRRAIGIEREPKWAALSRERCQAEVEGSTLQARRSGQIPLFGGKP